MKMYLLTIIAVVTSTGFASTNTFRDLASVNEASRVDHARELLGDSHRGIVFDKHKGLERRILATVKSRLPKAYKKHALAITQTIIEESINNALDPYFVMAVIGGESSFNPSAKGPVGEIGLMQIRLSTGKWIAELNKLPWSGAKTLRDPIANIRLGVAYIAWLREKFDNHGQLYLAAYNMGARSVKRAVGKNVWPKDYPRHVMKRYLAFYKEMDK